MSIFRSIATRLFGRAPSDEVEKPMDAVEYNGYRIRPAPYPASGGFQTAGIIEKDFPDGMKEHRFVRAETHATSDGAAEFAISKGKQIIDQQGDSLFRAS
jgi:hypothetical protein